MNAQDAKSQIIRIAQGLKWSHGDMTKRSSLRRALDVNPGLAREAGVTSPDAITQFLNEACAAATTLANSAPVKARADWLQFSENERTRLGKNFDYDRCYRQFFNSDAAMNGTAVKPVAFGAGKQSNPTKVTPINPGGPTTPNEEPSQHFGPQQFASLGLRYGDQVEAAQAFVANGGSFANPNYPRILLSLASYWADKNKTDESEATAFVKARHPILASHAPSIPEKN